MLDAHERSRSIRHVEDHMLEHHLTFYLAAARDIFYASISTSNFDAIDRTLLHEFDYHCFPRSRNVDTVPALVATRLKSLIAAMDWYKYKEAHAPLVCSSIPLRATMQINDVAGRGRLGGK
jgi:hypothetical protein